MMKKLQYANSNHKKVHMSKLLSNKVDFKAKHITGD